MRDVIPAMRSAVGHVRARRPGLDIGHVRATDAAAGVTLEIGGRSADLVGARPVIDQHVMSGDPVLALRLDAVQDPFVLGLSPYAAARGDIEEIDL